MVSFAISVLWGIGQVRHDWDIATIMLTPLTGVLAIATFLLSIPLYIWGGKHVAPWTSITSYLMMCATISVLIITTGHNQSPFLLLWMLLTVFAGLYGVSGVLFISVVNATYVTYILSLQPAGSMNLGAAIFTFLVPIVISVIIWRKQGVAELRSDKAYSDLAKELSQVANKSEIVINAIADGVIAINKNGTIQLINPAAQNIMGWGKQDAIELDYRSVFRLVDDKDKPLSDETNPIQQVLQSNTSVTRNDLTLVTSTGKKMYISLLISPVGQPGSGAIIVFRDITSDVAENRQKAEFVSTASHEMRTPVAAIEGYIALALNPSTATIDDKARAYLLKAHESAKHLGQLFQDLLDVTKAEDGRLNSNPVPIEVATFVRNVISTLSPTAQNKQITLEFAPDIHGSTVQQVTPAYYVHADQNHYREVLSNLIENGIKYTKAGGKVTVNITGDESRVVVSIIDTGIGIPPEDISHLFQKFYRVDTTDTREIGGTGLGLYLCRRLVEAMEGRIWVESEYGKGSMFFVELPRLDTTKAQELANQTR